VRADVSATQNGQSGLGLGLSIARRIVEAHGGTIAAENNAKRGASFVVALPKPA
jgi:signal transduction histidine kinase